MSEENSDQQALAINYLIDRQGKPCAEIIEGDIAFLKSLVGCVDERYNEKVICITSYQPEDRDEAYERVDETARKLRSGEIKPSDLERQVGAENDN